MLGPRPLAVGFVGGLVLGAGGVYLYVKAIQPAKTPGGLVEPRHSGDAGLPQTEVIRVYEGYTAAFDYRTKNPKWVLEHITDDSVKGNANRRDVEFFEDPGIEPWLRSSLAAYRNSGYDRGHMAPAADHRSSQTAMNETFCLNNISPQVGDGFNRNYWARFEKFIKNCTRKCSDVFVVTGPLWLPTLSEDGQWQMKYPLIGQAPALVSVPTHFYKVVLTKGCKPPTHDNNNSSSNNSSSRKGGSRSSSSGPVSKADVGVAAFVMPNAPIDPATPLSAFVVPLQPLEAMAGTRFFPNYLSKERMQFVDQQAAHIRTEALAGMKFLDRQAVLDALPQPLSLPPPSQPALITAASAPVTTPAAAAPSPPAAASMPSGSSRGGSAQSAAGKLPAAQGPGQAVPKAGLERAASSPTLAPPDQITLPQGSDQVLVPEVLPPSSKPAAPIHRLRGREYTHLCDLVACTLPPPWSWDNEQGSGSSRSSSGSSRGGGGGARNSKALTRR